MSNHAEQSFIISILLLSTAALAAELPSANKILAEAKAKAGTEKECNAGV